MARYSLNWTTITPTATGDSTADLVDSTYPFLLQGGNTTMRINVNEIYIGGEAPSASSPTIMKFARSAQVATGTIGAGTCRNALIDGSATAPGTIALFGHTAATNKPRRSTTLHLLNLSFNAFGGIARWQARFGEELSIVGNAASLGECTLSAYTGGTPGAMSGHCLYEIA